MNKMQAWAAKLFRIDVRRYPRTWGSARGLRIGTGHQTDNRLASVTMACVEWMLRTAFCESPLQKFHDPDEDRDPSTPDLDMLFDASLEDLQSALIDWLTCGNGWLLKQREGQLNRPARLEWIPAENVSCPSHDRDVVQIQGGGTVPWEEIVLLRWGMDRDDPRLGYSPMAALTYEIDADMEAAMAGLATARNLGRPGLVMAPKDGTVIIPDEELNSIRTLIHEQYSGANRGMPLVMASPTEVHAYPAAADDGQLSALRQVAEERVAAVYGIPAAVVGFGTGMQQTKVGATMAELRRQAYMECVLPLHRRTSTQLARQLLPDFEPNVDDWIVEWPLETAQMALVDERQAQATRLVSLVGSGILTVNEARHELGLEEIDMPEPVDALEEPEEDDEKGFSAKYRMRPWERDLQSHLNRSRDSLIPEWQERAAGLYRSFGQHVASVTPLQSDALIDTFLLETQLRDVFDKGAVPVWEQMTSRVATSTVQALRRSGLGLDFMIPDPVQQEILKSGGLRVGLLDLAPTTKEYVFRALAEAREEGLGASDMATRIADSVSRGRFATPEDRALVIARTETMHAQNVSTLAAYEHTPGVGKVRALDNQVGYNDEDCMERDGKVFSFSEARAEMPQEHPNGTLSWNPVLE